jgi:hypothetical protein
LQHHFESKRIDSLIVSQIELPVSSVPEEMNYCILLCRLIYKLLCGTHVVGNTDGMFQNSAERGRPIGIAIIISMKLISMN